MNLSIFAKVVEKGKLSELLESLHGGSNFSYIIVTNWREIRFERFDPSNLHQVNGSEWGRAFGNNAELRWRRDEDGSKFLCRWIFENVQPTQVDGAKPFPKVDFDVQDETYLLWGMPLWENGQWMKDENGQRVWYVTRIPRKLVYPIDEHNASEYERGKPLCLRVRFYMRNGRPVFDRFVGLEPCSEGRTEAKEAKQK